MAQLHLIKSAGGILVPASPETSDILQKKIKIGAVLCADFKQARNAAFHRKFFSLLNLGFEYWIPTGGAITPSERKLVTELCRFFATYGSDYQTLQEGADYFLERVALKRAEAISAEKSFTAFRKWVTVQAGFYTIHQMPDGSIYKEAKSISFANMDNLEFSELYKSVMNVLWNYILFRNFPNQQEVENAAAILMNYWGAGAA